MSRDDLAELERAVDAKRRVLSASLAQARLQLQPAALSDEVGKSVMSAATTALREGAEKARTPLGMWSGAAAVAISLLTLATSIRAPSRAPKEIDVAMMSDKEVEMSSLANHRHETNTLSLATTLATSIAIGTLLAKVIPRLVGEEEVIGRAGAELRLALGHWTQRQVTEISRTQSDEPFRVVNAIALGLGLLLTTVGARSRDLDNQVSGKHEPA
jgi:hypothetical protein